MKVRKFSIYFTYKPITSKDNTLNTKFGHIISQSINKRHE